MSNEKITAQNIYDWCVAYKYGYEETDTHFHFRPVEGGIKNPGAGAPDFGTLEEVVAFGRVQGIGRGYTSYLDVSVGCVGRYSIDIEKSKLEAP